jgi:hypothetical protein
MCRLRIAPRWPHSHQRPPTSALQPRRPGTMAPTTVGPPPRHSLVRGRAQAHGHLRMTLLVAWPSTARRRNPGAPRSREIQARELAAPDLNDARVQPPLRGSRPHMVCLKVGPIGPHEKEGVVPPAGDGGWSQGPGWRRRLVAGGLGLETLARGLYMRPLSNWAKLVAQTQVRACELSA